MKTAFKAIAFPLVLLFFSCISFAQTGASPALYEAQKGELKLQIVGSIHAGRDSFYPLSSDIEHAFEQADVLYLEIAPEHMTAPMIQQAMMQYGVLSTPIPLSKRMNSELYAKLVKELQVSRLPAHQLMFMRDWSVVIQLTVAAIERMGLNSDHGVDQYFAQKADSKGIPVLGLETLDDQFSALSSMDNIGADALYQNYFDELALSEQWLTDVEAAWRNGNSQSLNTLYTEYDARQIDSETMQKLLIDRNINWQKTLSTLKDDKVYMVVVGDMHVHGDTNILQLLKQSGFEITRINKTTSTSNK
ncbi:TraB/GumN family protein [Echinimonas agarilytica]|uniref:TraB/GumN family protein n=1 Tax=Echinimonas agarilytica TaxID=1215918 RepID=A0AA41W8L0_9GAMM|nr:TraB/GumN family protein [Echinimonas agarilytica]MCM2680508.1 TraB/GumN family protein [Echinimonas agarilytica]